MMLDQGPQEGENDDDQDRSPSSHQRRPWQRIRHLEGQEADMLRWMLTASYQGLECWLFCRGLVKRVVVTLELST